MSNVHDQLSKNKPTLVARIISNQEVTGMIMGFLNIFHGLRKIKGLPIERLEFGPLEEMGNGDFTCKLSFNPLMSLRKAMWRPTTEVQEYARSRADHFAETLRINPAIERWMLSVVEALERWAESHGCAWENIQIESEAPNQAVVTRDLQKIRFRVKKKLDLTLVHA
jgi:hypothetical protein